MLNKLRRNLPDVDSDDLLAALGLESRRTASDKLLPSLALFGAGLLLGVGLGLMLAPKPGAELRTDLRKKMTRQDEVAPELLK